MITRVVMGKLSPTMEEGTVVRWSKQEGDAVKVGEVLAEIETDKANMEMEALGAGILKRILVPAGRKAPVGTLIGVIADPTEDISALLGEATLPDAPPVAAVPMPIPAAAPPAASPAPVALSPAPVPAAPASVMAAAAPTSASGGRVKASPLARRLAAERQIPLSSIAGSGPGGRVIRRDVLGLSTTPGATAPLADAAAVLRFPTLAAPAVPAPVPPAAPPAVGDQQVPLSSMRRTIARRLTESKATAPHFYVTVEIAMDAAVALREQLVRTERGKLSFNDLVVKASALALARFPMVNASWAEDKIVTHGEVHVGVAVAIPDGLIVPVVRNADRKTVLQIGAEVRDLATRARDRKLKPEEFAGGTFSISNLGMMDVEQFTAIINPPESAILAVGAVRKTPVVVDDRVQVGHRMKVTLSCDHRVVDGALAAQFLAEVRRLLENPASLLI
jgi:pyruvate dehydrogenase E2 component (dihydrolipoamide acetyltransferase)